MIQILASELILIPPLLYICKTAKTKQEKQSPLCDVSVHDWKSKPGSGKGVNV